MNAGVRKGLYRLGASVLGLGSAMFALQGPAAYTGSPWLSLGLLLAGIAGAGACMAMAWRIDADGDGDERAPLREALGAGEIRGVSADPALSTLLLWSAALALAWLAWTDARDGDRLAALLCGAIAAAFAAAGAWRWRTRAQRRELRIDAAGVHSPDFGLIRWADVAGLRRYRSQGGAVDGEGLQLLVRDPARYLARLPAWQRHSLGLGDVAGQRYAPLLVPLDLYRIPLEAAYVTATTLRRRIAAPFVEGWQPQIEATELDELLAAAAPLPLPPANASEDAGQALQRDDPALPLLRRQLRHRARQRRWRESALTRRLIVAATVIGYVAIRAWSEGLLG